MFTVFWFNKQNEFEKMIHDEKPEVKNLVTLSL
jgi:hypothetical protein